MHTSLLHKQHAHFPAIQILFSYENTAKSQRGNNQPLLQGVEDAEDFPVLEIRICSDCNS